jgi:hypothetical protein
LVPAAEESIEGHRSNALKNYGNGTPNRNRHCQF